MSDADYRLKPVPQTPPQKRHRSVVGGPEMVEFSVTLQTVTPILGGGVRPREVDTVDVIRAPTIRGHLRFWWRALYGHEYESPQELYAAESALWGRAAERDGGRSGVEICVFVDDKKKAHQFIDRSEISMGSASAYALWPARSETKFESKPAERYRPGTKFRLVIRCKAGDREQAKNAVRAWILFGGYGGRTRRGVGSLTVYIDDYGDDDPTDWLPVASSGRDLISALYDLFGFDVFASTPDDARNLPVLGGASLCVGQPTTGTDAWTKAITWLKDFRQGQPEGHSGQKDGFARERGDDQRPGRSKWPEADKVRRFSVPRNNLQWAHLPRHKAVPAWPRGGFGLPIIGQFQKLSREWKLDPQTGKPVINPRTGKPIYLSWENSSKPATEPDDFELHLQIAGEKKDRLGSSLILKALPLANGDFLPCALWLFRAYPANSGVVLVRNKNVVDGTLAPFDRLVAPDDTAQFAALSGKASLRDAFFGWLQKTRRASRVQVRP